MAFSNEYNHWMNDEVIFFLRRNISFQSKLIFSKPNSVKKQFISYKIFAKCLIYHRIKLHIENM